MSVDRQRREALFNLMAAAAAGETVSVAWAATQDMLSSIVGVAAEDQAHAHVIVDAIARDLHANMDKNWDHYRAQRGKWAGRGSA